MWWTQTWRLIRWGKCGMYSTADLLSDDLKQAGKLCRDHCRHRQLFVPPSCTLSRRVRLCAFRWKHILKLVKAWVKVSASNVYNVSFMVPLSLWHFPLFDSSSRFNVFFFLCFSPQSRIKEENLFAVLAGECYFWSFMLYKDSQETCTCAVETLGGAVSPL